MEESVILNTGAGFAIKTYPLVIEKTDLGNTVVFCSVCNYKIVLSSGATPIVCPATNCAGILQFIDVTEEFFTDD